MATSGVAGLVYATTLVDIASGKTVAVKTLVDGAGDVGLAIGTTATTAMAGNKVPTPTERGGVLSQAAIADLTAAPVEADINKILAALRAAGILAS